MNIEIYQILADMIKNNTEGNTQAGQILASLVVRTGVADFLLNLDVNTSQMQEVGVLVRRNLAIPLALFFLETAQGAFSQNELAQARRTFNQHLKHMW